jgi:hypothetical protein
MNWLGRFFGSPLFRTFYQDPPAMVATTFEGGDIPDDIGTPEQIQRGAPTETSQETEHLDAAKLLEADADDWNNESRLPDDESEKEAGLFPEGAQKEDEGELTETPAPDEAKVEAALKVLGIEGHKSLDDYFQAKVDEVRKADWERTKMLLDAGGIKDLKGETMAEGLEEIESRVLAARRASQGGRQQTQDTSQSRARSDEASPLDDLMAKHADKFNWTPEWKGFLGEFSGMMADAVQEAIDEVKGDFETRSNLSEARQWYNEAKAALGEGENAPSLKEAWALLQLNPDLVQRARDRYEVFQDVEVNPMKDVFAKWRGTQTATGLTKGEQQKRDAEAKKVRDLKKLGRGERTPKSKPGPAQEMEEMQRVLDSAPAWS